MSKINNKSVLIAGAAAGAVMNAIDIAANYFIDSGLVAQLNSVNRMLWVNMNAPGRFIEYVLIDFFFAIAIVWLYAAMRPRFGPGPQTALRAAGYGWALYNVTQLLFVMMGLFTLRYVAVNAVLLAVNYAASALVGARLYREAGEAGNREA
jgi:hypothetical protein